LGPESKYKLRYALLHHDFKLLLRNTNNEGQYKVIIAL